MTVKITNIWSQEVETFRGEPEQIVAQLLLEFPWAMTHPRNAGHNPTSIQDVLRRIHTAQDLAVEVE